jgi:hypothetical protein
MSERPVHQHPRRLADWINPTGAKKLKSDGWRHRNYVSALN